MGVDGDALGAQALGERLGTEVYPTLLLLGGDESEWIRIPGGLGEDTFCAVIDAALRRRTSMIALAGALGGTGRELHDDDLTLLAYHYRPQDQRVLSGNSQNSCLSWKNYTPRPCHEGWIRHRGC